MHKFHIMNTPNYWLVGANWAGNDLSETFYRRGCWEMGYDDIDQSHQASKRSQVKIGDRIALKSMNGRGATTITIRAIGIVKDVADKIIYIDWKITDLKRIVTSHGAFQTIQGPYLSSENWTQEVFCL